MNTHEPKVAYFHIKRLLSRNLELLNVKYRWKSHPFTRHAVKRVNWKTPSSTHATELNFDRQYQTQGIFSRDYVRLNLYSLFLDNVYVLYAPDKVISTCTRNASFLISQQLVSDDSKM